MLILIFYYMIVSADTVFYRNFFVPSKNDKNYSLEGILAQVNAAVVITLVLLAD